MIRCTAGGQPQEKNAFFYNNHYRRFIVMEELTASLQEAGFPRGVRSGADRLRPLRK